MQLKVGRWLGWLAALGLMVAAACLPAGARDPSTASLSRLASSESERDRLASEVLAALNSVRSDPANFSRLITALLRDYSGTLLRRPKSSVAEQTVEGRPAAVEAIGVLRAAPRLLPVTLDSGLSRAARDHAVDQQHTGATGHVGSNGSTYIDRVNRYGTWGGTISENIEYGPDVSGLDVIENLIIDDGVPDRGHRRDLLDPTARVVGIACAPHPTYGKVCVIELATSFVDK